MPPNKYNNGRRRAISIKLGAGTDNLKILSSSLNRLYFTQAIPITLNKSIGARACKYCVYSIKLSPFLNGFIHNFTNKSPNGFMCDHFPHLTANIVVSNNGEIAALWISKYFEKESRVS